MPSVNRVILIGTLGKDPELKHIGDDKSVCNFGLATTRKYKDQQGQWQDDTEWHKVCAFGKLAEVVTNYCVKGSVLFVEGHLQTRKYQKDGIDTFTTNIVCDNIQLLGGKRKETSAASQAPAKAPAKAADPDDIPF